MKYILSIFLIGNLPFMLNAQPSIQWQKTVGGSEDETIESIQQTTDGGYIVAGITGSKDGDVAGNHGAMDAWVTKMKPDGSFQWQKTFGGSNYDDARSIQQTSDGGYVFAGTTGSIDGDLSSSHGMLDFWVVKLTESGTIEWQQNLGGKKNDQANSVQQTADGGFIVAGVTESGDGDVTNSHGKADYWVLKLSGSGALQWEQTFGGSDIEEANTIRQTSDGGYIAAGFTKSYDGDISADNHGSYDYWVVKMTESGLLEWAKSLGGSYYDYAYDIQLTADGGYVLAGYSFSSDGDVFGQHGAPDSWIVKLNATGGIQWKKLLGGNKTDLARSVQQTTDGGYIVAGMAQSNNGNVSGNHGNNDCWVLKLSSTGSILWQKSLGGAKDDLAYVVRQTLDGGYLMAGHTQSNNGNVTSNHGGMDAWLVKISPSGVGTEEAVSSNPVEMLDIFPNPSNGLIFLEAETNEPSLTLRIYDASGRQILEQSIPEAGPNPFKMDISALPNGLYSVLATTPSGKIFSNQVRKQE